MAKENWLPSPAPKVFSEITAPTQEEKQFKHDGADRAKRLIDAITVSMCEKPLNPVNYKRRPPNEKKNASPRLNAKLVCSVLSGRSYI